MFSACICIIIVRIRSIGLVQIVPSCLERKAPAWKCGKRVVINNDITRIYKNGLQNLDNQIWKSKISISTTFKLYNTCILRLPTFLYDSKC